MELIGFLVELYEVSQERLRVAARHAISMGRHAAANRPPKGWSVSGGGVHSGFSLFSSVTASAADVHSCRRTSCQT